MSISSTTRVLVTVLAAAVASTACFDDLRLAAYDLEIGPNPAIPGDQVTAVVMLEVIPVQQHTIVLTIDGTEHFRVTSSEPPGRPYIIQMGDAADLIATYGTGVHSARVELRADEANESAGTRSVSFELKQPAP